MPINFDLALDYCANWWGPGTSVCTPERLEAEALAREMDWCEAPVYAGIPGELWCWDYWPPER